MPSFTHYSLKNALENKGFQRFGKGKHPKYVFVCQGKKSAIFVQIRNSRDELRPGWMRDVTSRLRMPDEDYLKEFISCSVSGERYLQDLLKKGKL